MHVMQGSGHVVQLFMSTHICIRHFLNSNKSSPKTSCIFGWISNYLVPQSFSITYFLVHFRFNLHSVDITNENLKSLFMVIKLCVC